MLKIKDYPKNKIIVIAGGSFQGKSLIALHIACKFRIPLIICTDTIRSVLHILHPRKPYFFTSTYLLSPKDLKRQKKEVSKLLRELMALYERRGENIIIEGMHLAPEFVTYLSNKANVLNLCLDNKLSLEKRLECKSLTRCMTGCFEPGIKKVKHHESKRNNRYFVPYMKHSNRIEEIHRQIVTCFLQRDLPVVRFADIHKAEKKIGRMVEHFFDRSSSE